jgi:hypothetical protein
MRKYMVIITLDTYRSTIYQKKQGKMVRNEWKGMLIVGDDERDVSRSCDAR